MTAVTKRKHKPHPDLQGHCRDCDEVTRYWYADDGPAYHYWMMIPGDILSARPVLVCPECMDKLRAECAEKWGPPESDLAA